MTSLNGNPERSINALKAQIASIEQTQGQNNLPLAALYNHLALACQQRIEIGASTDLSQDRQQTIDYFNRAIALQTQARLEADRMNTLNGLGNFYSLQGYLSEALRTYQQALELSQNMANSLGVATSQNALGNVLRLMGQFQKALRYHQQALKTAQRFDNTEMAAKAIGALGDIHSTLAQYEEAIALHQQELSLARQMGDRTAETAALNSLGIIYDISEQRPPSKERALKTLELLSQKRSFYRTGIVNYLGHLAPSNESIILLQSALDRARKTGNCWSEAVILVILGRIYLTLTQTRQAELDLQTALNLAQTMNAAQIATAALIHLGLIDSLHGVHPRSTERYRKAIVLAQQMGDHAQEGTASMLLGDELSKAKQPQQSVSHYQRALEIAKQMGLQSRQKLLLTKLGEVLASKDSSSATKALQEASQLEQQIETQHQVELQLAQRMGAHHREVEILNALARQSHHKKDYAQAIEYAERSQEIAQRINDPLGEYGALKILGDIYGVLKQPQQELEYYQQCLVTAQRAGEPQLEAFTWKYLGFILIRVSDTSSAIRCLQSAHDLFKSLRLEEEATLVNKEIKALKKP